VKRFEVATNAEPIEFSVGDDVFKAVAPERLPGNILIRYAEKVSAGRLYEAHQEFFARCLEKESAELFAFRLDSKENPINLSVMAQVAEYLTEMYSNFPTAPPKP
jgi:hypothetical protein